MAKKPKKKLKHTHLVLPGEAREQVEKDAPPPSADRLGRVVPDASHTGQPPYAGGDAAASSLALLANEAEKPTAGQGREAPLPKNAIVMPKQKKPRFSPVRAKKRRRRIGALLVLLLVLSSVLLYSSGVYLLAAGKVSDWYDTARLTLQPGEGFPANFAFSDYVKAEPMGSTAYAVLGDKDMAVLSKTGRELYRVQHGFVNPGLTAGEDRLCLFNRGGKEYTVESRYKTLVHRPTEQEILFVEMSPNGSLAVVTSSRFRANLRVYNPLYEVEPDINWPIVNDKPVLVAFQNDNKHLALGCLKAENGALGSVIYVLRSDSDKMQATIAEPDALLLQAEYISGNKLLAVYNTFAAVYDSTGKQLTRYDYAGQTLQTAYIGDAGVALVFGSGAQESVRLVVLDAALASQFEATHTASAAPKVILGQTGVFLLVGTDVFAYALDGQLANTLALETKPNGLVDGAPPLVLTTRGALSLQSLLDGTADAATTALSGSVPSSNATQQSSRAVASTPSPVVTQSE